MGYGNDVFITVGEIDYCCAFFVIIILISFLIKSRFNIIVTMVLDLMK